MIIRGTWRIDEDESCSENMSRSSAVVIGAVETISMCTSALVDGESSPIVFIVLESTVDIVDVEVKDEDEAKGIFEGKATKFAASSAEVSAEIIIGNDEAS